MRYLLLLLPLVSTTATAQPALRLKPSGSVAVQVREASDLCMVPGTSPPLFHVVSDNGYAALMRADGSVVRRSTADIGHDLEGALLHQGSLIVVDERTRSLVWLDTAGYGVKRRLTIPYHGGRNKGYEAVLWNPAKQRMLLVTERDPVRVFELDSSYRVVNEVFFDRSVRDVSSGTWHNGHPWLLSDMDMLLMKCDPLDYHILERYAVPVINPEGLEFGPDGLLYVLSDDRQRLYTFPFPPRNAD